ncbi:hypothetical protein [Aeromonas veronii]|uniref:hypothetical protein n=1 Tax=Aeromonas veronii TaxID=654 RepID=UPI003BA0037F
MTDEVKQADTVSKIENAQADSTEHVQAMVDLAEAEGVVETSTVEKELAQFYADKEKEEEAAKDENTEQEHSEKETDTEVEEEAEKESEAAPDEWQKRAIEAEAALLEKAVFELTGGKEEYTKLTQWAANTLSKEEIEFYDSVMEQGTPAQVTFAVNALKAMAENSRYNAAGMKEGTQLSAAPSRQTVEAFATQEEAFAAMENPVYYEESARGEAYRQQVAAKIANSGDFGWQYR